ncbi:L-aspartate oxidase [Mesorhizobium sp.]|uniref:L-aspartate oxidase n=1 Tax=Mesorhizobium sp. TaxID=1871066 RepID=UPI000FE31CBA|nr:L-aspartate oxidase [Mesorhizobium sp.]RWH67927.1 MAG: L-aspartate oxidase [Mesorhizobium sp.]RWL23506.1 MAG: L-aspartate oxidase [Mesorhizobium sp.]RWL25534.1 MAG: L-aspartate oxidase [Mesorhizobium sp.]RWL33693.1 MAG: L-aspartate oxidase [Mesorhizobium sp.]RWL47851.1 MAG: L-aspartate oxidase [Mesorhizobium sp.]
MSIDGYDLGGRPVIIGGGIAGLMTALRLAPEPVLLLSKSPLGAEASSALAQGGLAASLGADDDPALHLADTLAAGDGLCDAHIASGIVHAAPVEIEALADFGVRFDRDQGGRPLLGLEAAHSRHRIVHATGDGTGRELMRALAAAVLNTPSIRVTVGMEARQLITHDGAIAGVLAEGPDGPVLFATQRVILATGGTGGLFLDTTNPLGCFGQGLALAARAGAELADMEFIQFHPTALDGPSRPMHLVSEALRGEGAILIDEAGRRFLGGVPGADLAARDVVARAVWKHLAEGHRVYLDARQRPGVDFASRFPAIHSFCRRAGIDPANDPIPIRPAAHYHMGGIAVDEAGRSSVAGLWACGEAACTGLHGANRLASNSLTEAVVSARSVAQSVAGAAIRHERRPVATAMPPQPDPTSIRPILSRTLGVLRTGEELSDAIAALLPVALGNTAASDPAAVGLMIAVAAWRREESRGAHFRTDFPRKAALARRSHLGLDEALGAARALPFETTLSHARSA